MMRRHQFIILLFLSCILNSTTLHAQDYLFDIQNLTVLNTGFSSRDLYHPFQDQEGYIWVGTGHGLDRYDGRQVKHFPLEKHGLRFKSKFRINEDGENNLWLHYQQTIEDIQWTDGVDVFDPIQGKTVPLNDYLDNPLSFPEDQITWVSPGPDQSMLISTSSGAVYAIKSRQAKKVYQVPSGEKIHQLFMSGSGGIWVMLWREVIRLDQSWSEVKRFQKSSGDPVTKTDIFDTPYEDELGQLHYVALNITPEDREFKSHFVDGKVKLFSQKHMDHTALAVSPRTGDHYFMDARIDPEDGSKQLFLVILSPDGDEIFRRNDWVRVARHPYFDRQGILWHTSHFDMKVVTLEKNHFKKYIHGFRSTSSNERYSARGIIEDGRGNLLVSGPENAYSIDLKSKKEQVFGPPFTFDHPFLSKDISYSSLNFAKDSNGNIWMTDESFRLLRYEVEKDEFTEYTYPKSLFEGLDKNHLKATDIPSMHRAMIFDKRGTLWLGHNNGVSVFDPENEEINWLRNEGLMAALAGAEVMDIHENGRGLWLATTKGIYLLDPIKKQVLEHHHRDGVGKNRLPVNSFVHIYEDRSGIFWLASDAEGLIKWWPDQGKHEHFTTEHGLSDNHIYAVYEDGFNNLWLPSSYGLNQFNKLTNEVIKYGVSNGIAHLKFNPGSHYRGSDSTLYFGGLNGITAFNPREIVQGQSRENTSIIVSALTKRLRKTGRTIR